MGLTVLQQSPYFRNANVAVISQYHRRTRCCALLDAYLPAKDVSQAYNRALAALVPSKLDVEGAFVGGLAILEDF